MSPVLLINGSMRLFKSRDRLFFGSRTGGNKIALGDRGIPPAGVRPHKRASLIPVEGTSAYLKGLMRIKSLPFESHKAIPN